jgi:hypothetical protein
MADKPRLLKRLKPLPWNEEIDDLPYYDGGSSKKLSDRLDRVNKIIREQIAIELKTYDSKNYSQKFLQSLIPKK